ncbi:MAG: HAD family hydrolase [Paenibacillaceae bacterium]
MIKAIIFDFDGLILDTETPGYHAYREMFEELGAQLPLDEWAKGIGTQDSDHFNPLDYLEQQIGRKVDRAQFKRQAGEKYDTLVQSMMVRPGVVNYLKAAQTLGVRIGLASSSSRSWVENYLNKYELISYFQVIRTKDDVMRVKPDPELYLQALEHLGVKNTEAVVFEDSLNGLRAAKAAGIYCVVVPNEVTSQLDFSMHDLRLVSMEDMSLEDIIKKLAK